MNIFRQLWFWIIIVAILIAGIIIFVNPKGKEEIALKINEEVVTMSEFQKRVAQAEKEFSKYDMQPTKKDIKEYVTNSFIQEILLVQYAKDEGLEVSQAEIDEKFDSFMSMYGAQTEDELLGQLQGQGFETKKDVEEVLGTEILVTKLFDIYADQIEITEEDLQKAYEQYKEQTENLAGAEGEQQEVPPLDEVQDVLKENLIYEKATPLILDEIEKIREESAIEILVEEDDILLEETESESPTTEDDLKENLDTVEDKETEEEQEQEEIED